MQDFFHQQYVQNAPVLQHLDPWVTGCLVSFVGLLPRKETPTITHTNMYSPKGLTMPRKHQTRTNMLYIHNIFVLNSIKYLKNLQKERSSFTTILFMPARRLRCHVRSLWSRARLSYCLYGSCLQL